jgi:hypothetical protein
MTLPTVYNDVHLKKIGIFAGCKNKSHDDCKYLSISSRVLGMGTDTEQYFQGGNVDVRNNPKEEMLV